jgi:DNA processing protein
MARNTAPLASDADALAWLALATCPGLLPRQAFGLIAGFGGVRAVLAASPAALADAGAERFADRIRDGGERARAEAAALGVAGAGLVTWADARYPARLRAIADPPLALAVRGTLGDPDDPHVAIVGTRRASEYGRRVATTIARGLAEAGITVVSGLAAGIDGAAHRAALEADGRTVAMLGTGVDRVYPSWHRDLAEAIAARGALVSEFPCGTPPLQFNFPRRNRLISGIALGTVVVEAAEESGSLITARYAVEQNRAVYAVPGPLGPAAHRGPHRLIQEGARLVTCAEEIIEDLAPQLRARLVARRQAVANAALTASERGILALLGGDGRHVDEVIGAAGVPPAAVLEMLLALELRGLVRQLPGKRFCRLAA